MGGKLPAEPPLNAHGHQNMAPKAAARIILDDEISRRSRFVDVDAATALKITAGTRKVRISRRRPSSSASGRRPDGQAIEDHVAAHLGLELRPRGGEAAVGEAPAAFLACDFFMAGVSRVAAPRPRRSRRTRAHSRCTRGPGRRPHAVQSVCRRDAAYVVQPLPKADLEHGRSATRRPRSVLVAPVKVKLEMSNGGPPRSP